MPVGNSLCHVKHGQHGACTLSMLFYRHLSGLALHAACSLQLACITQPAARINMACNAGVFPQTSGSGLDSSQAHQFHFQSIRTRQLRLFQSGVQACMQDYKNTLQHRQRNHAPPAKPCTPCELHRSHHYISMLPRKNRHTNKMA